MKRTLPAIAIGALFAGLVGGALAQDNEAELSDNAAVGEEQAADDEQAGFEEMEPGGAALDSSIASMQVSEVEGKTIVNAEDETLGKVEKVLRHKDAGDLHAVVSVGGFWFFGASAVALPLSNMQFEGEQLVLQDIIGKDELDALATDYDEDRYSEVGGDMSLSEAMER